MPWRWNMVPYKVVGSYYRRNMVALLYAILIPQCCFRGLHVRSYKWASYALLTEETFIENYVRVVPDIVELTKSLGVVNMCKPL